MVDICAQRDAQNVCMLKDKCGWMVFDFWWFFFFSVGIQLFIIVGTKPVIL